MGRWTASLAEKTGARDNAVANLALFEVSIKPHLTDSTLCEVVEVSTAYAVYLYEIVVVAGRLLLQHAYRAKHGLKAPVLKLPPRLTSMTLRGRRTARSAWPRSRLLPLARHDPAGAFDPPPGDMEGSNMQGTNEFGIGATVDSLRANTSSVMRL